MTPEWMKWRDSFGHHEQALKRRLGLRESDVRRMPPHIARPPREVDGVRVCILSADVANDGKRSGAQSHRVLAECPKCKTWMSAGRLHQHLGFSSIGRGRRAGDCLTDLRAVQSLGLTAEQIAERSGT